MSRRRLTFGALITGFALMLGLGISCSKYYFMAYPDIEVRACAKDTCPDAVKPAVPPGSETPTIATFPDKGVAVLDPPSRDRTAELSLRIYNSGEGLLRVTAPKASDIVVIDDPDNACTFNLESVRDSQDEFTNDPCIAGVSGCTCLNANNEADKVCDPGRADSVVATLALDAGAYAEYVLTYSYSKTHGLCKYKLPIASADPDRAELVGEVNSENPWDVILRGNPSCSIEITPASHDFGSNTVGKTLGQTFEMQLSDNCEQVRLTGLRIVDPTGATEQRGALGSLCTGPSTANGEPEVQQALCAESCYDAPAGVNRCSKTCTDASECGNNMDCQQDHCWPLAPYDTAGAGGGSDMAILHFSTYEAPEAAPVFPAVLRSKATDEPDGWFTTTFTCAGDAGNRDAVVQVDFDLDFDGTDDSQMPSTSTAALSGICGECPVAMIAVTAPPLGEIKPLDTVELDGTGSTSPSGKQIRYKWYFNDAPADSHTGYRPESNPGATNTLQSESTAAQPQFFVDLAGVYEPCLQICEEGGACTSDEECGGDTCLPIDATPREAIHIQLVWDHPETDVDLHYMRSGTTYGDRTDTNPGGDCHFFNPRPDYCVAGDESDDPSLDIDDVRGYGPENTNHNDPCDDDYRIWVSYYEDKGMGSTRAKVRIFVKGQQVAEESHVLDRRNCHWMVGTVSWSGESGSFTVATEGNYICGVNNPEQP